MKRLICFDLDGTLSQHKTPITQEVRTMLDRLSEKYKIMMVGAGNAPRIWNQMGQYPIDILGNYGMQEAVVKDGQLCIVREDTVVPDKEMFLEKCAYLREKYGYTQYYGDSVEFHPAGMVTFCLLGTPAPIDEKIAFDPTREKRRVLYPEVLELFPDHSVYIGGSSSFDFTPKQYNKYDAIMKYAAENGYSKEEILYVGDDFEDGGGDSHIRIYGMDYICIDDYRKTPEILAYLWD
ncbi:MAG: HAD hydrolase family protein [Bacteroidales bacterium]|nr:HAD hydrolase family protein [Bacteroidales bacterium]